MSHSNSPIDLAHANITACREALDRMEGRLSGGLTEAERADSIRDARAVESYGRWLTDYLQRETVAEVRPDHGHGRVY